MLIMTGVPFHAMGLRSNRHRRLERLPYTTDIAVEVAEVSTTDAPLICEIEMSDRHSDGPAHWQPFRRYRDRVWCPTTASLADIEQIATKAATDGMSYDATYSGALQRIPMRAAAWAAEHIILDGRLWATCHEPQLSVKHWSDATWVEVTTDTYRVEQPYRLDEIEAITQRYGEHRTVNLDEVHIRNLQPDLLRLPRHADRVAERAWHGLAVALSSLGREIYQLDSALGDVTDKMATGGRTQSMPADVPDRIRRVLADLQAIAADAAVRDRAGRDPADDHKPAPLPEHPTNAAPAAA